MWIDLNIINPICRCENVKNKIINLIESSSNFQLKKNPNSDFILHYGHYKESKFNESFTVIIDNPITTIFVKDKNKNKWTYNLLKNKNIMKYF